MTRCILINDSQMASRRMLRFALQLKGCEIIESSDSDESLALLKERRIDLLLVSLYPKERVGYALLEQLSESLVKVMPPVILVGDRILRADYGIDLWRATAWLERPFRVSELMTLVDTLFNQQPFLPDGELTQTQ